MASNAQMDRLVGRALFDKEFGARLLADPEAAARTLRTRLTEAQVARIRTLDPKAMEKLAAEFEKLAGFDLVHSISFW